MVDRTARTRGWFRAFLSHGTPWIAEHPKAPSSKPPDRLSEKGGGPAMNTSNKMSAGGNLVGAMLQPEEMRPATGWRQSRWLAFVEFAIVGLIFIGDHYHLVPISKTPFLLVLGWIPRRGRRLKWKCVGFARNRSWGMMLALGFGGGLILEVIQLFVTQPLVARITGKQPDLSDFRILQGNV